MDARKDILSFIKFINKSKNTQYKAVLDFLDCVLFCLYLVRTNISNPFDIALVSEHVPLHNPFFMS